MTSNNDAHAFGERHALCIIFDDYGVRFFQPIPWYTSPMVLLSAERQEFFRL
jgi:hypothetical protein